MYALPPAEFTAARNAWAAASDSALARALTALRKPSVSAWAVNLLAGGGELAEALDLSRALREAQDDLDAAELSRLGRQRRALVTALARQAVVLASDRGVTVSSAARDDIEKTLNAAVIDAGAAGAVMTGRLVRGLQVGGSGLVELDGVVAGSPSATPPASRDELAVRRTRKAAERRARESARAASTAQRELMRADSVLSESRERVDRLRERAEELRADLARVEHDAASATAAADAFAAAREEAAVWARTAADDARAAADDARAAAEEAAATPAPDALTGHHG
ncbi:MAG: transposase [Actinobacteria bacterium]|nr:transposase [Actinomycetota bacterium]